MEKSLIINSADGWFFFKPHDSFYSCEGKLFFETKTGPISEDEFFKGNYKLIYPEDSNELPELINLNSTKPQDNIAVSLNGVKDNNTKNVICEKDVRLESDKREARICPKDSNEIPELINLNSTKTQNNISVKDINTKNIICEKDNDTENKDRNCISGEENKETVIINGRDTGSIKKNVAQSKKNIISEKDVRLESDKINSTILKADNCKDEKHQDEEKDYRLTERMVNNKSKIWQKKKNIPCWYYQRNCCKWGDKCHFRHEKPFKRCWFFENKECLKGKNCPFMHNSGRSYSQRRCWFFENSCCKRGDACKFFHDNLKRSLSIGQAIKNLKGNIRKVKKILKEIGDEMELILKKKLAQNTIGKNETGKKVTKDMEQSNEKKIKSTKKKTLNSGGTIKNHKCNEDQNQLGMYHLEQEVKIGLNQNEYSTCDTQKSKREEHNYYHRDEEIYIQEETDDKNGEMIWDDWGDLEKSLDGYKNKTSAN